jgi:hypothetical protein
MLSSTQTLPENYIRTYEIDLAKNKWLAVLLNIAGFFIFILSFALLGLFASRVHPGLFRGRYSILLDLSMLGQLLGLLAAAALMLVAHELIHGFFFWAFTRSKPVFALHLAYAYAAAPGWFIPACQYGIIGLSPLVIITAVGLLVIGLVPAGWVLPVILITALNIGGAAGDMLVITRLLRTSSACLANDAGDRVCFFEPARKEM